MEAYNSGSDSDPWRFSGVNLENNSDAASSTKMNGEDPSEAISSSLSSDFEENPVEANLTIFHAFTNWISCLQMSLCFDEFFMTLKPYSNC